MSGSFASSASGASWGEHVVGLEQTMLEVGPLRIQLRRQAGELWISHSYGPPTAQEKPTEWGRWVLPDGVESVSIAPALPDRTIVAAPELSFHVTPGASARIYLRVPVVVAVESTREPRSPMLEIPSVVLSDTWWGDFLEGELCYWLPTSARREVTREVFEPHLVVCPVEIHNRALDVLNIEKLAIRARHLSIFTAGGRLWADETVVHFRGEDEGSEIETTGSKPRDEKHAILLRTPRSPIDRSFTARTFARLKSISGLGG